MIHFRLAAISTYAIHCFIFYLSYGKVFSEGTIYTIKKLKVMFLPGCRQGYRFSQEANVLGFDDRKE